MECTLKSIKEFVEGGWEGALEEGEESGCSDSCSEYEIQRLVINSDCNFCGVTKILDKEVTMSGFSTFTLERNCISLNFSVSILFLNQDVPFCLSEK